MSASKLTDRISLETIKEVVDRFPYGKWEVAGVATGSYLAYKMARFLKMWLVDSQFSPLKDAPGPDSDDHILMGQFHKILNSPPSSAYEEWFVKYGPTIAFRSVFLVSCCNVQYNCRMVAYHSSPIEAQPLDKGS